MPPPPRDVDISVGDPVKCGEGIAAYVTYKVRIMHAGYPVRELPLTDPRIIIHAHAPHSQIRAMPAAGALSSRPTAPSEVTRRFRDFSWLRHKMHERHKVGGPRQGVGLRPLKRGRDDAAKISPMHSHKCAPMPGWKRAKCPILKTRRSQNGQRDACPEAMFTPHTTTSGRDHPTATREERRPEVPNECRVHRAQAQGPAGVDGFGREGVSPKGPCLLQFMCGSSLVDEDVFFGPICHS